MNSASQVFLIDSSAIFSGKPLNFDEMMTTSKISDEFQSGGRDYQRFQLLCEKGMKISEPSKESITQVRKAIERFGEQSRLSLADISILALAIDVKKSQQQIPIIVTDDYSIQNIANHIEISIQSMSQKGITKRFKWERRCRGCRRKVSDDVDVCPDCGSSLTTVVKKKYTLKKHK